MLALESLKPMLLDERERAPPDENAYVAEPKFDGYRVLGQFGNGQCQLRSRNGADCTKWFQEVSDALAEAKCGQTIVDGEMCVLDEFGRSDFEALHQRARRRRYAKGSIPVTYCIFDLLFYKGQCLTDRPLVERKATLRKLLEKLKAPHTLFVQHLASSDVPNPISWLYEQALAHQLEGVVGKREDSIYEPGVRSKSWFKLKRQGAVPAERFKR